MVDVANKATTFRAAKAQTIVVLPEEILKNLVDNDIVTKKGAVFQTANIAGIMAAKQTANLIPLCHQLPLNKVKIDFEIKNGNEVFILSTVNTNGKTGVEMEALTASTVAALTVYDMCKALSHKILIKETKLISKTGGKSEYHFE